MCDQGVREDERHFVFECPRYAAIRAQFPGLFEGMNVVYDRDVKAWMNPVSLDSAQVFWPMFASFLGKCLEVREHAVAAG
jgi:hypothetical protein